jgi:hypothetical protein
MPTNYRIVSWVGERPEFVQKNVPQLLICDAYNENDAEEIGAAMAKAGFNCEVWDFNKKIHEFYSE